MTQIRLGKAKKKAVQKEPTVTWSIDPPVPSVINADPEPDPQPEPEFAASYTGSPTPDWVVYLIARYFGVHMSDIYGGSRKPHLVTARSLAAWFMYRMFRNYSFPSVADALERRNHTTVFMQYYRIEWGLQDDGERIVTQCLQRKRIRSVVVDLYAAIAKDAAKRYPNWPNPMCEADVVFENTTF